jgi:hypothetical protein
VQKYALDFQTLVIVEIAVFAVLEYKRYSNFKKDGRVRFPFYPLLYTGALKATCLFFMI